MEIHSPRRGGNNLAARVAASEPQLDEKSLTAIFNSLRDRIYQRSFNLRKTFRELDAEGKGAIPIEVFAMEMVRAFSLNAIETKCLRVLLDESDFKRDGKLDFQEFCEMLKLRDYESDPVVTESQQKRLQGPGLMDPRMQRMMRESTRSIEVRGGVPTNELGHMQIECPFGVLGDSERMDAVISAFFTHKTDTLRTAFQKHDSDHDGWLTRQEFRNAMKEVDRYVFDDEIDSLLESLLDGHNGRLVKFHKNPSKQANQVNIEEFVCGPGREYLKKKAHRSNAHANPFIWTVPDAPRTALGSPRGGQPGTPRGSSKHGSRKLVTSDTRASELRGREIRAKLLEQGERRREDKFYAAALDERRAQLGTAGGNTTPRLPLIASARGAAQRP